MPGHGLSVRKLQNGDYGVCTGPEKGRFGYFPLFRLSNIAAMREALRQLSLQAEQLENQSQWSDGEKGSTPGRGAA